MPGRFSECSGPTPRRVTSGVPVPISNDLFEGAVIFTVTANPLPAPSKKEVSVPPPGPGQSYYYWEAQVQGKFKKEIDSWFMGLELSIPMKLGMMSRAICMTLLKFVKSFEPDTHATAGEKDNREMAHMVTRHFRGVDYLVITPDGETPPRLGASMTGTPRYRPRHPRWRPCRCAWRAGSVAPVAVAASRPTGHSEHRTKSPPNVHASARAPLNVTPCCPRM